MYWLDSFTINLFTDSCRSRKGFETRDQNDETETTTYETETKTETSANETETETTVFWSRDRDHVSRPNITAKNTPYRYSAFFWGYRTNRRT
jgi:hypothetical protein